MSCWGYNCVVEVVVDEKVVGFGIEFEHVDVKISMDCD
jgi:hypothetical protein